MLLVSVSEHMVVQIKEDLSRKEYKMESFYLIQSLLVGAVAGLLLAHYLVIAYRKIARASDKRKIKIAMLREQYYNDLYTDVLTEDVNKIAKKAHRRMSKIKAGP